MIAPGVAEIHLRQLRRSNRYVRAAADRAALEAIATIHGLPRPRWRLDKFGRVGTVRGTDAFVENAVGLWAEALAAKPIVVPAEWRMSKFYAHGWAVVHLSVDGFAFTVGGRLVEDGGWTR